MALFKISKGSKANLPTTLTEGFCWYTYDDSKFYIDYKDENGILVRKALNAKDAETLMGASLATVLSSSDVEIPTSKAVLDAINDIYVPTKVSELENDSNFISEDYVEAYFKRLNSDNVLRFYCIEDVTVVTNGISTVYPANSNVEVKFLASDVWEVVPTSNNSILALNAFPGALATYYPWLEGVKQFSNILFDMNAEDMYTKWNQGNQGAYQVQYAQYLNCIFWSDNAYVSELSKRTNYTLYYTSQLPLCYSTIPDNTFKAFYLAFNVNSDPNWGNKAYRDSFAKATWATQVFSYYGARTIGIFGHDNSQFNIVLPKDCRGLMSAATAIENAGTFDAANTTNFGASSGSWRDAFGWCSSLRNLYIKNLKVNLNVSWSPLNYDSISYIISAAANTSNITIYLSPYTYNLLGPSDFELAASKNITIALVTANYVEDRRLSAIVTNGDGTQVLSNDGTYKALPAKTSQLENDSDFITSEAALDAINDVASDLAAHTHSWNDLEDKPFYGDVIESIVWDGDADGKDIVTVSYDTRMRYVKVSERYFEQQDLIGGKFTLYVTDSNREASLDIIDDLVDSAAGYGFADSASWCVTDGSEPNVFVIHSEEYFEDWGLFTPGVYVLAKYLEFDPNIVSVYVSEIEFPFDGKTISERYIPDTIARKSDVAAANHTHDILETSTIWTNELFVGDVSIEQLIENVIQRMMDAGRIIEN